MLAQAAHAVGYDRVSRENVPEMAKRLIDISQPMIAGMPGWLGDIPCDAAPVSRPEPACAVYVVRYLSSTRGGTDADAPLHHAPAGAATDAVALDARAGGAQVLDLRHAEPVIEPEQVQTALDGPVERVLSRSWQRCPHSAWIERFGCVSPDTIRLLADPGVVPTGTDAPSIDPQDCRTPDAHQAVRAADMHIPEGLVLDDAAAVDYELIALPLRRAGLDAAPVRAMLRCP